MGIKQGSFRAFGAVDVQPDSLRIETQKSRGKSEADVVCSFFVTQAFECCEVF